MVLESLCIEIMNSNKVDWQHSQVRRDMLENEVWLQNLAEKWSIQVPVAIAPNELDQLKQLRSNMQVIVNHLRNNSEIMQEKVNAVNQVLNRVSSVVQLVHNESVFETIQAPNAEGWSLFIWSVADSFSKLLAEKELVRIKVCDNHDCGWIFYDESKNKSRRWCDEKACGNIMKVRNFRARKKQQQ